MAQRSRAGSRPACCTVCGLLNWWPRRPTPMSNLRSRWRRIRTGWRPSSKSSPPIASPRRCSTPADSPGISKRPLPPWSNAIARVGRPIIWSLRTDQAAPREKHPVPIESKSEAVPRRVEHFSSHDPRSRAEQSSDCICGHRLGDHDRPKKNPRRETAGGLS